MNLPGTPAGAGSAVPDRNAPVRIVEFDSIKGLLELCGLEVRGYSSGAEFLNEFLKQPTRCVLCAAELPDMRGIELYQRISSGQPCVPFALLASRRIRDTLEEARSAGIDAVLNKPMIDPKQLLRFVGAGERVPAPDPGSATPA